MRGTADRTAGGDGGSALLAFDPAEADRLRRRRSFWRPLRETTRSVGALVVRETVTRFGQRKLGYFWAFFEPGAFILIFVLLRSLIGNDTPFGESIALFLMTGLVAARVALSLFGRVGDAIKANRALLTYPTVQPLDTVLARIIVELLTMAVIIIVFYLGLGIVMGGVPVQDLVIFTQATIVTLYLGVSVGTLNASLGTILPAWSSLFNVIRLPLFIASAIFFVPRLLAPEYQAVLQWNPILHCVEWYRTAIYMDYLPLLDRSYPIAFGTVCLALGLWLERTFRLRISAA